MYVDHTVAERYIILRGTVGLSASTHGTQTLNNGEQRLLYHTMPLQRFLALASYIRVDATRQSRAGKLNDCRWQK